MLSRLPSDIDIDVSETNSNHSDDSKALFFETSFSIIETEVQLQQLLPLLQKGFAFFDLETILWILKMPKLLLFQFRHQWAYHLSLIAE